MLLRTVPRGPVLLLGGPGTGKTTVLYFRILRLLGSGVRSDRILFLTPHDHAADKMQARLTHPDEFETTWTSINDDLRILDQFRVVSELAPSVRAATIEQFACRLLDRPAFGATLAFPYGPMRKRFE